MATFVIVAKNTNPLGPNEIPAGETIDVASGDVFIVSASADDNIKFESATGDPTNFEVRFESSNPNDFNLQIMENLDAEIIISGGANLSDIDIDADNALSVIMTAGDAVSLGKYVGSETGTDVVTIGNGFSTDHDIKLNGGDNFLTIGDDANIRKIESEEGTDWITIGDRLVADDIKTGDGNDTITIGDGAVLHNIESGKGDDSITIGDDLFSNDIKTDDGDDVLSIGAGALVDDIDTGKGDDTVSVGDFFTADKLETKDGDDVVIAGANGSINDLDGGNDLDRLNSKTDYPDASNFEIVCFVRGTRIETEKGYIPIETLRVGDRVRTLDHGFQRIRWIDSTQVPGHGVHAPVRIAAGALGNTRALWVSQQHRMLLSRGNVELYFGEPEVLVAAKHLVNLPGIRIVDLPRVEYFHMLFDQHEIVFSEGTESESLYPGSVGMCALSHEARAEIYDLFPALASIPGSFGDTARYVLRSHEARLVAA